MRITPIPTSLLISTSLLILTQFSAHAGLREEVANKKFICSSPPDREEWLWFDPAGSEVFRYAGDAEFITPIWNGDRALIWGEKDQDPAGPFMKEGGGYVYDMLKCREVNELPIQNIPKSRVLK